MYYYMSDKNPVKSKRILIIHYRVGKTDGVSLQIASYKEILESHGAKVVLCSGPENIGADYVIKDLEQQLNPEIFTIDEDAFEQAHFAIPLAELYPEYCHPDKCIRIIDVSENFRSSTSISIRADLTFN